jgi:HSP20 family protein
MFAAAFVLARPLLGGRPPDPSDDEGSGEGGTVHPSTIDLMRNQARAIYQALTGTDLPEGEGEGEPPATEVPVDEVARRFADLEAMARRIPTVKQRISSFSFAPPLDVRERDQDLVIEVAVPGIDRDDVAVEVHEDTLVISGVLRRREANGNSYLHTEIPTGAFYRVVKLPYPVKPEPRLELDRGLVVIRMSRPAHARNHRPAGEAEKD